MNITQMHDYFRVGVDKAESFSYPAFEGEEIDYFLNKAQERFIKQRYGINNLKRTGFEQTQKRTDDIREVIEAVNSNVFTNDGTNTKPYAKDYELPAIAPTTGNPGNIYWFSIQEEADIVYIDAASVEYSNTYSGAVPASTVTGDVYYIVTSGSIIVDGSDTYDVGESFLYNGETLEVNVATATSYTFKSTKSKRVGVKPIQHDDYNKVINDPFNKPNSDQALRLMHGNRIELITGADFDITRFYIRYVRKPLAVDLANTVDCELADHTHEEIVDIAVSIALEGTENSRYQTNLNELNKNE
jgi:hypothetical protein